MQDEDEQVKAQFTAGLAKLAAAKLKLQRTW